MKIDGSDTAVRATVPDIVWVLKRRQLYMTTVSVATCVLNDNDFTKLGMLRKQGQCCTGRFPSEKQTCRLVNKNLLSAVTGDSDI